MIINSPTGIANLALSHLASGVEIQNIDTEKSAEALACRRYYESAVRRALRDFPWPFATRTVTLSLVSGPPAPPTNEWQYSYTYPSDCLRAVRIPNGITRQRSPDNDVPFRIQNDGDGNLLIFTDQKSAMLEYTMYLSDPTQYTPDFLMAVSFLLAAYIAPRLARGDQFKLGARAYQLYQQEIERARDNALNEQTDDQLPDGEFIRAREGFLPNDFDPGPVR